MNNEYRYLQRLVDIKKELEIIIVEGFDEEYGFSDQTVKAIVHCQCELEEVVRLLAKTHSASLYGSIVNNTEI